MPTGSAATPIVVSIARLSKYSFTNAARVTFVAHDAAALSDAWVLTPASAFAKASGAASAFAFAASPPPGASCPIAAARSARCRGNDRLGIVAEWSSSVWCSPPRRAGGRSGDDLDDRRHDAALDARSTEAMTDAMEGVEAAAAASMAAARAVSARVGGANANANADASASANAANGDDARATTDDRMDDGEGERSRRGRGSRARRRGDGESGEGGNRGRVSVLDRLGKTNQNQPSRRGNDRGGGTFKRRGEDSRQRRDRRDDIDRRYRDDDRRGYRGPPRGPPPLPRGPPPGPCRIEKREADGVVIARAFGAEIIQVSPTGEMCLRRPTDAASDGPRCDTEVLNAFNSCLNKFGFKVSASPADQTQWSLSDGKRLSRFVDGVIVPAPVPPGPGRGLAMMLTAPVGGGRGGGRGGFSRGGRGGRGGMMMMF